MLGNRLLLFTVRFCCWLAERGCWFSIENPTTSFAWSHPAMKRLTKLKGVRLVRFDQCEYGLTFPDARADQRCKKDTMLLTNAPLDSLARKCQGTHEHIACMGGVRTSEGWRSRSSLAGRYPKNLCTRWARLASVGWDDVGPSLSQA